MVSRSGYPTGFSAARWLGQWLQLPCSALGGKRPAEYLNSQAGLQQVESLFMQMEFGA